MQRRLTRGQRLRQKRESLLLTQYDIANELGCSQTAIGKIESTSPASGLIERYEDLLRMESIRWRITK